MGTALKFVGGLWAVIGVAGVFLQVIKTPHAIGLTGLLMWLVACVLPGLALLYVGDRVARRAER